MLNIRHIIDVSDFDKQVTASGRKLEYDATAILYRTADEAAAQARRTTLYKNVTGKLRLNTVNKPINGFLSQLQANRKYASYVHDGTSKITARPFLQIAADAHEAILARRLDSAATEAFG